jgi:hypothetical protein
MGRPVNCIQFTPRRQDICLREVYINLKAISRSQAIDHSYLSLIFAGKRLPSIAHARSISACLGMGLEDFLEALDERVWKLHYEGKKVIRQYQDRIEAEDAADHAARMAGKPVIPRLPALRRA